jgi:hypothetical protein
MELHLLLPTRHLITISPTLLHTLLNSLAIRMLILPKEEATPLPKVEATPLPKGKATPLLKGEATRLHPRMLLVLQGTENPPQNLQSRGVWGEDCFQGKDCWERQ